MIQWLPVHSALLAKQIYTGTQVCFARSALCTLKLHLRALAINNNTCCCNGGNVGREMGILLLLLMTVMTIKVTTPFIPVVLVDRWAVSLLLLLMMMVMMVMMMKVIPVVLVERWAGSRLCNKNDHCQHHFDNL